MHWRGGLPDPDQKVVHSAPQPGWALAFFVIALALGSWAASVGWTNPNLRGVEFRQAQTALSTYFIQQENNYSLAYPTPVLGKPWSVPMEFPLYQWTVAKLATATGAELAPLGRAVSVACLLLALPAVFLLLGEWAVPTGRRWIILGLIVSNPLYIVFARSFLIETMALMFAVWFLLAYWRTLRGGSWAWVVAANAFGIGAGLVKVTTFMLYLIPAAAVTGVLLWRGRARLSEAGCRWWTTLVARAAAATAVPFVATVWWMRFADALKRANPSSRFLVSDKMYGYHFGTSQTRFDATVWAGHWRIMSESVVWMPLVVAGAVVLLRYGAAWRGKVWFCLACFMGIQVLLPELYAWHDYYYVANALFLLVALGLAVTAIFDSPLPRWVGALAVGGVLAGQGYHYVREFYPALKALSPEGNDLSRILSKVTQPNQVLLIQGEDWNSMTPYYARRRALMLRAGVDQDEAELRAAFEQLRGEAIGALVTDRVYPPDSLLIRLAVEYFGFNPRPMVKAPDRYLYFPDARWDDLYDQLQREPLHEAFWAPAPTGGLFAEPLAGQWYEMKALKRYQTVYFKSMQPRPVRFFCWFGPSLNEPAGEPRFGAHPLTQLVFAPPAGHRRLSAAIGLSPGAYENVSAEDATDGVELVVSLLAPDRTERVVFTRLIDPVNRAEDRGTVPVATEFDLPVGWEVQVAVTAGPAGVNRRDWAYLGPITIE